MDRPKILIIDDEEFIRTLLSEVLDGYASKIVELELKFRSLFLAQI